MQKYREWLPANGFEGNASLGGSYYSNTIDDYYLTPYDLGYGGFVKFDHDFIGRGALEKIAARPHRTKVTLELNDEDVMRAIASQFGKEHERAKYFDFPSAVYSMYPFDRVMKDGKLAGLSTWVGYSSNERRMLTLAMLDPEHAKPGSEVSFVWGEEGGGSKKPTVESTGRSRSARSYARCRTWLPCGRSTWKAAGVRPASCKSGAIRLPSWSGRLGTGGGR